MASELPVANGRPWWSDLTDECPITLEPLSTLPYPPFELRVSRRPRASFSSSSGGNDAPPTPVYRFDGLALASFAVSRGVFQNPLTREPLTREDCVRLDAYLQEHCYVGGQDLITMGGPIARPNKICVTEAFMLREAVKVRGSAGPVGSRSAGLAFGEDAAAAAARYEAERRRADALRSEAASALRGLFVFGNDRGSLRRNGGARYSEAAVAGGGGDRQAVPSVGFNLYGHVPDGCEADDGAAVLEMDGLRIVDDDLEIAASSDEAAWRELGELFPRLNAVEGEEGDDTETPPPQVGESDGELLRRTRDVADRTRTEEERFQMLRERCRERMIGEAIRRREERMRQRERDRERRKDEAQREKEEGGEVKRARDEIEQWRAKQWEEMQRAADAASAKRLGEERKIQAEKKDEKEAMQPGSLPNDTTQADEQETLDKAAAAKAKKAAKRRKAKERQKTKKAAERAEAEKLQKREEVREKKEASALKCGACSVGILDCGFERLGVKFCSAKCARAGPSNA